MIQKISNIKNTNLRTSSKVRIQTTSTPYTQSDSFVSFAGKTLRALPVKNELLRFLRAIPEADFKGERPKANLHIHSLFSDGKNTVRALIEQAIRTKKKEIAITDHNTTEHLREIENHRARAEENGLTIINGVELTAHRGSTTVHLLVYGADPDDAHLNSLCQTAKLSGAGKTKEKVNAEEAVKTLSPKYVVVLAHPMLYKALRVKSLIRNLQKNGLDGVEAFYPYNKTHKILDEVFKKSLSHKLYSIAGTIREKLSAPLKFAKKCGLLLTGGKDSHSLDIDAV